MIGNKFKGLGKGLSALMGDVGPENIETKNPSIEGFLFIIIFI